ncbi:MAG: PKD domain-containing protein, partial [Gammaproteobacteria bacterium]|nr:PKD domain-containing protein [Gammaproteobacteria bacterium]
MWWGTQAIRIRVLAAVLGLGLAGAVTAQTPPARCDADGSGEIDRRDLTLIMAAIRQPVSGPTDPRDGNADNQITLADATYCRARCTFSGCNSRPVANAGRDEPGYTGILLQLDGSASVDPDGQPLSFSWSFVSRPAGSTATLADATTVRPSFTPDVTGDYEVQLVVSDGSVSSTPDTVLIANSASNIAPVASAGPDQAATVGTAVQLDGSGSTDIDGDVLAFTWQLVSVPAGSAATLSDPALLNPVFTPDVAGTYAAALVVGDGQRLSAPDTVLIAAGVNATPVADAGPDDSVSPGANVLLDGRASYDPNNATLRYRWSFVSRPAGSSAALSSATAAQPLFVADLPGVQYVLQLIVNDGKLDSQPDTVVITTTPGSSRPIANAGPDQSVAAGPPPDGAVATIDGSASYDPDGAALGYQWALVGKPVGSTATLPAVGLPPEGATNALTTDRAGKYVAQLIVSDGELNSTPDTAVVTGTNSRAPVAIAGPDQSVLDIDVPVQLVGDGSYDPDGCPLRYQWQLTGDPGNGPCSAPGGDSSGGVVGIIPHCGAILEPGGAYGGGALGSDLANPRITSIWGLPGAYQFTLQVSEEPNEATGCGTGGTAGDSTIVNVQHAPRVSIADVTVTEGDSGTVDAAFTVSVTGDVIRPASVAWSVNNGSAQSPSDFLVSPASGVFNFPVGYTGTETITVAVVGDTDFEQDETFSVMLSAPLNMAIGDGAGAGTGTIENDDLQVDPEHTIALTPSPLALKSYQNGTLTLTLGQPAPAGGLTIGLISDDTAVASVPASATVPEGATTTAAVPVTVGSTAGSAKITASAAGWLSAEADVAVTNRSMSVAIPSTLIGIGRSTTATITLAEAAPATIAFDIESTNAGAATVPASVTFSPGQTTRTFTVSGVGSGAADIRVTAPGYVPAQTNVSVSDNMISLGEIPELGPQESASLPVRLALPAPAGGVTVDLESLDSAIATVSPASVFIVEGAILPTVNPQVTGVGLGTTQIRASDGASTPVYAADERTVNVRLAMALSAGAVSVKALRSELVLLTLSAPAPANFSVTLSSDDPAVATIAQDPADATPNVIEFIPGTLSRQVRVTGVAEGTTSVRASAPFAGGVILPVTVTAPPNINASLY